jgi:hypothetical protein
LPLVGLVGRVGRVTGVIDADETGWSISPVVDRFMIPGDPVDCVRGEVSRLGSRPIVRQDRVPPPTAERISVGAIPSSVMAQGVLGANVAQVTRHWEPEGCDQTVAPSVFSGRVGGAAWS